MDIALTGSSGLIGKALASYFTTEGHTVHQLKRDSSGEYEPLIEGCEVVINLAGAPVACRWSDAKKKEILNLPVYAGLWRIQPNIYNQDNRITIE